MSKIVSRLLDNVTWLDELSSVTTIFFVLLFIALVVGALRMKKSEVDELKNLPLDDNNSNEF